MIERIEGLPNGIFGFVAQGMVQREEADTLMNAFDATIADGYEICLLAEYRDGVDLSQMDEGMQFYNRRMARGRLQRLAFIASARWGDLFRDVVSFTGCDARMYAPGERDAALAWLSAAPFLKKRNPG